MYEHSTGSPAPTREIFGDDEPAKENGNGNGRNGGWAPRRRNREGERRCDCGNVFSKRRTQYVFLGASRFVGPKEDPEGSLHRRDHPGMWAMAHLFLCLGCSTEGWLMTARGTSFATGASWKKGDFLYRTRGTPPTYVKPHQVDATIRDYDRSREYQQARRKLVADVAGRRARMVERLRELAVTFPEKAELLEIEAKTYDCPFPVAS